ncbi:MAG: winged helix-turn-helix transcriptional regulator [Candidatus Kapabacteria bacterium]|nr:winged helix-turn-helix transcriptional regulator [Ignavibacteriota bacterium]MCW5885900.1 winged helix-turn-helix transcriptional regulator [Candidatus Kapabacteria bacterium]
MDELIKIAKALSDKNRIRILKMLEVKPLCVCEITEVLGIATSTASSHLSFLKDAGLIVDKKDGKWINYLLNDEPKSRIAEEILSLIPTWVNDDKIIKQDLEKIEKVDRFIITMSIPKLNLT